MLNQNCSGNKDEPFYLLAIEEYELFTPVLHLNNKSNGGAERGLLSIR